MTQAVGRFAPVDLNLLPLFVTVAETRSFAEAARRLRLPRSSVSRAISALETALAVTLFSRTTRKVALTTAGTALYAKVSSQLSSLKEALGTLPEREVKPSGVLRLTAPNDLGALFLPPVISGFLMRYPDVRIDLRLSNKAVDLVAEGFDAAIRVTTSRLEDSSLVARRLSAAEMQLFATPGYLAMAGTPRSPEDVANHAWVIFALQKFGPPLVPPVRQPLVCDDMMFVLQAVKAGIGIGLLPAFLAKEELAAGRLVRVLPRLSIKAGIIYLVHPPAQHVPRKVLALRDHLLEYLAAHPLV